MPDSHKVRFFLPSTTATKKNKVIKLKLAYNNSRNN